MLIAATSFTACTLDKAPPTITDAALLEDAGKPSGVDASGVILLAPGARHALDAGSDAGDMSKTGSSGSGATPMDAGHPRTPKDAGARPANSDRDAGTGKPKPPAKPPAQPCGGACTADKPRCLPSGMCAQCALDADCHAGTPRCNTQSFTCVACLGNADCAAPTPACDVTAHVCRACVDDSTCSGNTSRCDTTAHACVRCLDDSTCGGFRCDVSTHNCAQCLVDSDCTDRAHPECTNHVCSLCTSDAACTGRPGAGACDAVRKSGDGQDNQSGDDGNSQTTGGSGACVECTQSNVSACGSGMCMGGQNKCGIKPPPPPPVAPCTPCTRDRDCSTGQSCSSVRIVGRRIGSYCVPSGNDACLASCAIGLTLGCK